MGIETRWWPAKWTPALAQAACGSRAGVREVMTAVAAVAAYRLGTGVDVRVDIVFAVVSGAFGAVRQNMVGG